MIIYVGDALQFKVTALSCVLTARTTRESGDRTSQSSQRVTPESVERKTQARILERKSRSCNTPFFRPATLFVPGQWCWCITPKKASRVYWTTREQGYIQIQIEKCVADFPDLGRQRPWRRALCDAIPIPLASTRCGRLVSFYLPLIIV